jgi:hypothetical protein
MSDVQHLFAGRRGLARLRLSARRNLESTGLLSEPRLYRRAHSHVCVRVALVAAAVVAGARVRVRVRARVRVRVRARVSNRPSTNTSGAPRDNPATRRRKATSDYGRTANTHRGSASLGLERLRRDNRPAR